ncbi:MAG: hypothetical protein CI949_3754, partial [Halanaerobium sp.]
FNIYLIIIIYNQIRIGLVNDFVSVKITIVDFKSHYFYILMEVFYR